MNLFDKITGINQRIVPGRNTPDTFGSASGFLGNPQASYMPQTYSQKAPMQFGQTVQPKLITKQEVFSYMDKQGFTPEKQKEFLKKLVAKGQQVEGLNAQAPDLGVSGGLTEGGIGAFRAGEQIPSIAGNILGFTSRNITGPLIGGAADLVGANEFADKWRAASEKFGKGAERIGEDITMAGMTDGGTKKLTQNQIEARKMGGQIALTAPLGGEFIAGAKGGMTGLQGANLFSRVGLQNAGQGLMARSGLVGGVFGATDPIINKGGDATMGDIATGGAVGFTAGAVGAPIIGKTIKYGQAGYYGGATGLGKSITRDIKGAGQTVKSIGNALAPSGANISTRANRFNALDEQKFIQATGQTPGEFATSRGMTKVGDDAVVEATNAWQASKAQADEAFGAIEGNFKYTGKGEDLLKTTIDDLDTRLTNTKSPDAARIQQLKAKYENEGLTMSEINEIKRTYANNYKYSFLEQGSEGALRSKNLQDAIRKWQFKVAEENGLANIAEINKNTQAWKMYADSLAKKLNRGVANNANTLTDWIVLGGGNPENIALYLGKKLASSDLAKRTAIKLFSKQTKPSIIRANKADIQQTNFKKRVNRGISNSGDSSGGESMVRVAGLLPEPSGKATGARNFRVNQPKEKSVIDEGQKGTRPVSSPVSKTTPKKITPTPEKTVKPQKVETNITRNEAIEKGFSDSAKARWDKGEFTQKERGEATTYLKSNYKGKEYTIDGKKYKVDAIDNRNEQVRLVDSEGNILRVKTNKLPETKVSPSDIQDYYNARVQKGYKTIKDPTKTTVNLSQSKGGFIRLPFTSKLNVKPQPKQLFAGENAKAPPKGKTGWFKGADGKMRFEIDDSVSRVKTENIDTNVIRDSLRKKLTDYYGTSNKSEIEKIAEKKVRNNLVSLIKDNITPNADGKYNITDIDRFKTTKKYKTAYQKELSKEMKLMEDVISEFDKSYQIQGVKLGDVLEHTELFKQYPELENFRINIKNPTDRYAKAEVVHSPQGEVLTINIPYTSTFKTNILHEIQHLIQSKEKFATGGSPSDFEFIKKYKSIDEAISDITDLYSKTNPETEKALLSRKIGILREMKDKGYDVNTDIKELYKAFGGEVESRNVEARINMTKAERNLKSPESTEDVPRPKQIIRMDSKGPSMSIKGDGIKVYKGVNGEGNGKKFPLDYFTTDKKSASQYGKEVIETTIYPKKIADFTNPSNKAELRKILRDNLDPRVADEFIDRAMEGKDSFSNPLYEMVENPKVTQALKDAGYDSTKYLDYGNKNSKFARHETIAMLDVKPISKPKSIKGDEALMSEARKIGVDLNKYFENVSEKSAIKMADYASDIVGKKMIKGERPMDMSELGMLSNKINKNEAGGNITTVGDIIKDPELRKLYEKALDTPITILDERVAKKGQLGGYVPMGEGRYGGHIVLFGGNKEISNNLPKSILHESAHAIRDSKGRKLEVDYR